MYCSVSLLTSVSRRVRKISKSNYYHYHSVCLSVRLSFRMEPAGSQWTEFRRSVKKMQFSLKSDKKNGYVAWRPVKIYDSM